MNELGKFGEAELATGGRRPAATAVALVVAAGTGERLGAGVPKAFVVCHGRSLLDWSLAALIRTPGIAEIVVALPPGADAALPPGVLGIPGGAERSQSVRAALAATSGDHELVLVHDAARPLITPSAAAGVIAAAAADGVDGAIAATPVTDTIKAVAEDGVTVTGTPDRGTLWSVQTPQVFRRVVLERALAQPESVIAAATDDASLVESLGGRIVVVPTSATNIKVTGPHDLQLADLLLTEREESAR